VRFAVAAGAGDDEAAEVSCVVPVSRLHPIHAGARKTRTTGTSGERRREWRERMAA
jgi:hypothetical protein